MTDLHTIDKPLGKKTKRELEEEIQALNNLLLEMHDQNTAIGNERDKWKEIAEGLYEALEALTKPSKSEQDYCNKMNEAAKQLQKAKPNDN